jgi:hypothetical protein
MLSVAAKNVLKPHARLLDQHLKGCFCESVAPRNADFLKGKGEEWNVERSDYGGIIHANFAGKTDTTTQGFPSATRQII